MEKREEIIPGAVYTLDEVCKLLHVGKATARRWLKEGKLPKRQVGRKYRFLGKDLLLLLRETWAEEEEAKVLDPGDSLLKLAGIGSSGLSDVSERHDWHLAREFRQRKGK